MDFIDSHSHLFLEDFNEDLPQVIERARDAGVSRIFMPNIDSSTLEPMLRTCTEFPDYCFPMIGLHPTSVNADYERELEVVARELAEGRHNYVAVGEIGMDLYWDRTYLNEQRLVFKRQIDWALEYDLPIVIHCRDAFEHIYNVLKPYGDTSLKGIFHSFTGTTGEAARLLKFSHFLLGINGIVTFKKSTLPEVLQFVPLERVALETDAPYLAPVPCRGKRNESSFLKYTLMKVAEIYRVSPEEVARITSESTLNVFGMHK